MPSGGGAGETVKVVMACVVPATTALIVTAPGGVVALITTGTPKVPVGPVFVVTDAHAGAPVAATTQLIVTAVLVTKPVPVIVVVVVTPAMPAAGVAVSVGAETRKPVLAQAPVVSQPVRVTEPGEALGLIVTVAVILPFGPAAAGAFTGAHAEDGVQEMVTIVPVT